MKKRILALLLAAGIAITGCSSESAAVSVTHMVKNNAIASEVSSEDSSMPTLDIVSEESTENSTNESSEEIAESSDSGASEEISENSSEGSSDSFDLSAIPEYSGKPYVAVNDNVPFFSDSELTSKAFESYSSLDSLGRCGVAYACVGQELMPNEKRGDIGSVKPSGWNQKKYSNVDGKYLWNRCHLIGYQLSAENANPQNLITGTRYLNVEGMLPFENMTADYIKETGNHVLYRVTPVFEGNNLVASGVLMEAKSVEDSGDGILFNVYVYNVQPDIAIDYANGSSESLIGSEITGYESSSSESHETKASSKKDTESTSAEAQNETSAETSNTETAYIVNTNTKKFHYPGCSSVDKMSPSNKMEFSGSRDELISQGYEPCKKCNP